MKSTLNWPALIVLAVVLVLGAVAVLAILNPTPATSHDIVLAIVAGLVGALSMKAVDGAVQAVQGAVQTPPSVPSVSDSPKPAEAPQGQPGGPA